MRTLRMLLIPVTAVAVLASACGDSSSNDSSSASTTSAGGSAASGAVSCPEKGQEVETAKLYIEHNATDEDTGVHGIFGGLGEGWSVLCLFDPDGTQILAVEPLAQLEDQMLSDLFFESREPPNSEVAVADIEAAFPEGRYRVAGIDVDGKPRVGSALFTHAIPAAPTIVAPALAEDAETAGDSTIPSTGLVVRWEPVTETIDGQPLNPTGYEVIVTDENFNDPNGFSQPVYDVHVSPDTTSIPVADGFLQPGRVYELEVLALEESGNQTITVGFFRTA